MRPEAHRDSVARPGRQIQGITGEGIAEILNIQAK